MAARSPSDAARSLRILWVTTSASTDGPGRTLSATLSHWPDADQVAVCALRGMTAGFRAALPQRIETHALDIHGLLDPRAVMRLRALMREWRPDIVHTQLSRADWIGRVVSRLARVPVVSTIQNVHSRMYDAEFSWLMARVGRGLDRATCHFVDRLIAVSAGVKDDLLAQRISPDRIAVIHNGFDTGRAPAAGARARARSAWGVADADVVVGTVALLKTQKGIADLIHAARHVVSVEPGVRFVQMGDGPLHDEATRLIDAAGLGDRVLLLDRVEDPVTLLPGLDVFVLPSLWEGLPIALLEAMSVGLPAVGTRVSGIEEVIADGETGTLVPPSDPAALARALLDLVHAPDRRRAWGEAARARLAQFDARVIAGAYRRLYLDVLGRR
jgi:glycosyltransferase involved in cell wall biosynthesis